MSIKELTDEQIDRLLAALEQDAKDQMSAARQLRVSIEIFETPAPPIKTAAI